MYCKIDLKYKKNSNFSILIDEEDSERVILAGPWRLKFDAKSGGFLVYRRKTSTNEITLIHRFIMNISDPTVLVEYRDKNTLNNVKENLLIKTNSGFHLTRFKLSKNNSSGYTGIKFQQSPPRWHVTIKYHSQVMYLGAYLKKEKAIKLRAKSIEELAKVESGEQNLNSALKQIEGLKRVAKLDLNKKNKKSVSKNSGKVLSFADLMAS